MVVTYRPPLTSSATRPAKSSVVGVCVACGSARADAQHVKNLHLHDLRREHATQLSEAGVPVDVIREQLGHSNITMTNTYLGHSRDRLARAAKQRTAMRARKAMRLARKKA